MTEHEIAAAIQAHALTNYEKGWDMVVECWAVSEIVQELREEDINTVEAAIKYFQWLVDMHQEQALNTRFGDEW